MPLPHWGYTFDSAGLASATQPTLGNDVREEATPIGGCTFSRRTSLLHAANGLFANDFPTRKLILKSSLRSGVSMPKIHALCVGNERRMRPCGATRAGTQAPPIPISIIFSHATSHKQNNHLRTILSNEINHPCTLHPNETVGAVPVCPSERLRSGISIPKIHTLCVGNERWMRPCRATRAGTQAPPLPKSTKPRGVSLPHHIVHSIAHANRKVCSYPTVLHIR